MTGELKRGVGEQQEMGGKKSWSERRVGELKGRGGNLEGMVSWRRG